METLLHNAKRKKRKTRKCLDELRKRSRNIKDASIKKLPVNNRSVVNFNCNKKSSNCITSQRLTLRMFAKAVRSETITRPLLCDARLEHNPVITIKTPETSPLNIHVESKSSNISAQICNDSDNLTRHSDCENSLKINHDENSSDSLIWYSPTGKVSRRCLEANDDTVSTVTSTSRSNEEFGYHLYEELLEEIPLYVRRNLSNFVKYDVMGKTKESLQNLYMEMYHQDNADKQIMPSIENTRILTNNRSYLPPLETIVQDPMDYIKLGWQGFNHSFGSTPSDPNDVSPLHSPPIQSPLSAVQPLPSVMSYTPDYNFYPHRLNE